MRLTQVICPKCKASLSSKAGIEEGASITCPKCKQAFAAAAPKSNTDEVLDGGFDVVEEEEEQVAPKKTAARPSARSNDAPSDSKKRPVVEDDEDRKPAKRKRDDDEDDDDQPRKKKKRKRRKEEEGVYAQLKNNIWVRVGVMVVLLAVLGVASYFSFIKRNRPVETIVEREETEDDDKPIKPFPKKSGGDVKTPGADNQKFQGAWSAKAVTLDGQKYNAQGLRDFRFVIAGDRWQAQGASRNSSRSKIDSTKKLAEIDLLHGGAKGNCPGIYRFNDSDTLEVCIVLEGAERPNEFASTEGSKRLHMVLSRDKTSSDPKGVATDAERLKGSWSALSFKAHVRDDAPDAGPGALSALIKLAKDQTGVQQMRLTITDDQFIVEGLDESDNYTINTQNNPFEIDFIHGDGTKSLGICNFRDPNTLELCFSLKGDRPQNFGTTANSTTDNAYLVFRRVP